MDVLFRCYGYLRDVFVQDSLRMLLEDDFRTALRMFLRMSVTVYNKQHIIGLRALLEDSIYVYRQMVSRHNGTAI